MTNYTAHQKRQLIWQHNGFLGSARMMEMQLRGMLKAPTISEDTKDLIKGLIEEVLTLKKELKEYRVKL